MLADDPFTKALRSTYNDLDAEKSTALFDDDLDPVAASMHRGALAAADHLRTEEACGIDAAAGNSASPAA
ncbi:MAG: hypothetical protein J2P18_02325 [Nocardia sp.]|nr:hypothetical protein [Nocardia sp.]